MRSTRTPRAVVIGAGAGGLAAAAVLSRRCETHVFERASTPGGKMRAATVGDRTIDCGPTVFTMKWVFEALFAAAGAAFPGNLKLTALDVLARHGWRDGARFDLFADEARATAAVGEFAGAAEAERFREFRRSARRKYEVLRDPFLRAPSPSASRLAFSRSPLDLLALDGFSTLWSALERHFEDPRLRQLYGRYATYTGCSPFAAPATLMLIAHVEQEGVWAVEGGMAALAREMEAAGANNGARYHYDRPVAEIIIEQGRAAGVRTTDGEEIRAEIVVLNADVAALRAGLFGADAARAAPGGIKGPRSQSAITWATLAEASGFDLSTHTVFFSDNYRAEFDAVFARGTPPATPTVYAFAPDRPAGGAGPEPVFLLINAPAGARLSEEEINACRMRTFEHLSRCGLTLTHAPETTEVQTPETFAERFPATEGALYGTAGHGWMSAFQRPATTTRLPGLYLAGGSVHPGPGVPMATLSGQTAATAALAACGSM
ncbi:MAG: 1-hydroxycarotenoid 3,4-desaturase CrtD [Pseudomonadota bacterium]